MLKTTIILIYVCCGTAFAQGPAIVTPTKKTPAGKVYPWRKNITATIFWVGEQPTANNPTPNCASSWDTEWQENFGGYDNPNERAVIGFRPASFVPNLNPFYVALPYNDRVNHQYIKPEVPRVVPWYKPELVQNGASSLKGRWLQIVYGKKYCFAQWEDCGPFTTEDWEYVFGGERPKNKKNNNAGIDLSPAVRDYLGLKSGAKVHWRFVDASLIPKGPWKVFGQQQLVKGKTRKPPVRKVESKAKPRETQIAEYQRYMKEFRAKQKAERLKKIEEYHRYSRP